MHSPDNQIIWTVSALNHEVKTLLERGIGKLWLEGEISNLSKPASGHWYFSLKDHNAQIRVAMFKSKNNRVAFNANNGQQVLIKASVSLYEARGEFQVIAEHMEEAGTGKLMREFEALKNKLKTEGLFEPTFKQTIPRYPNKIGIITSPTGAAIRDALSVLKRRCPATEIIIYPCVVQGEKAAISIIQALQQALTRNECDVLLMIRGGGSIEDMWCFNDEQLAHLIYQSSIPVITGIGHEVDFTIADFVADFRAATPSVAAESASIDNNEIKQQLDYLSTKLLSQVQQKVEQANSQLFQHKQHLLSLHPMHAIQTLMHRLELLKIELNQSIKVTVQNSKMNLDQIHQRFQQFNPEHLILSLNSNLLTLKEKMIQLTKNNHLKSSQQLALTVHKLDVLSPLKTLSRGYAAVTKEQTSIQSIQQVNVGEELDIHLKDGLINTKINYIYNKN